MTHKITPINPPQLYNSISFGFSHAVVQNGGQTLHLAGQVAWDAHYELQGGDSILGQAPYVLANLKAVLAEVGATPAHIVRLRTYLVNHTTEDVIKLSALLNDFYEGHTPAANTLLGVSQLALPDFRIEIEATAVLPER
ncbi:RidA family protein [Paenalcaligenes hominis]|uniref:RidA family protein n=1 Tax=Paenalcaligenes hominis TaxID=643674 RepID=UPI0035250D74